MDYFEKLYNYSLRFLSYRPRSEKEIRDKLKRKKADSLIIERILQKLKEQKFVNDLEFTKWWIEQRTTFKPRSLSLIKRELKQKGICSEVIESLIQNSESRIQNDFESAKKLVQKRIGKVQNLPRQKIYQKLGGFLARKGFDFETIKKVIDEAYKEGV